MARRAGRIFPEQQPFFSAGVRIGILGEPRATGSFHDIMLRPWGRLGLTLLVLAGLPVAAQNVLAQVAPAPLQPSQAAPPKTATTSAAAAHKTKPRGRQPTPEPEVPQTPPPPPTLERQAPVPPQVSYQDGQLTIDSENATLSQVLRSVQTKTGASIDMPSGAGSERVVARLGPGTPKDVLAALLNGSKFNYVILGAPNQSGGVQKVILLSKSTAAGDNSASIAARNNIQGPAASQAIEPPEDEYPPPDQESENQLQPGQPGGEGLSSDAINASPALIAPGSRTPEQMLQELQRMQQQQQQMQQQLNPVNQQPAPTPFPSQPGTASPQPQ
jgi:hypothetical protein